MILAFIIQLLEIIPKTEIYDKNKKKDKICFHTGLTFKEKKLKKGKKFLKS